MAALQRRCYWLLDSKESYVLVHYLDESESTNLHPVTGKSNVQDYYHLDSSNQWNSRDFCDQSSHSDELSSGSLFNALDLTGVNVATSAFYRRKDLEQNTAFPIRCGLDSHAAVCISN